MLAVDENGWLKTDAVGDPEIRIVPTHRNYHLLEPPCDGDSKIIEWPVGFVWHTIDVVATMEALARRLADAMIKGTKSWNFGIARDGVIWQSAPLTVGTWHVGNPGMIAGYSVNNVNRVTSSCELESPGRLLVKDGNFYCYPYYRVDPATGRPSPMMGFDPTLRLPDHDAYGQRYDVGMFARQGPYSAGGWCAFTPAQVIAIEALVRAVSVWHPVGLAAGAAPPLGNAAAWRYGHVNFPGRSGKEDPGPRFIPVRDEILRRVFGAA